MSLQDPDNRNDPVDTRRLLDHMHVGLLIFTGAGHLIDMNRYARRMLKNDEPVEGRLIDEVLPASITKEMPTLFGAMSGSLHSTAKRTIPVHHHDATEHWEVTISRSAAEGGPDIVVLMLDDISELVEFERLQHKTAELERMNMVVREANQLKTEFLANMSHELRTPLNSIIGFADLMASGKAGEPNETHKEFLDDILTSARHLLNIINDVLDLSKIEAGKMEFNPELIDIRTVISEVTSILREQAAKRQIRIEEEIDPEAQTAVLDPLRLKQILYNYLSNAVKFSPPGQEVRLRVLRRDESIRLEVEDRGPGISKRDQMRLFVEFEQLDQGTGKNHQGTGLGLALTRRLSEGQGGKVGVESTPGKGSIFWSELPQPGAGRTALQESARRQRQEVGPVDPSARVLVVEDDDEERRHIQDALQDAGYRVDAAASARDAKRCVRRRIYDAITLDLLLPDGHGEDVLRALRTEGAHRATPVIIASMVEPAGAILGFPVVDFLVKPFDEADLIDALQRAGVTPERSILVVDDDPAVQRLVSHHLESLGYHVDVANDGEEGLDAARERPPGLVVLDLLMPGTDGFEFLERFRATPVGAAAPVIVWTTKDLTRSERVFLQQAAHKVLQKGDGGTYSLVNALRSAIGPGRTPTDTPAAEEVTR